MTTFKVGEVLQSTITGGIYKIKNIVNQMVVLQSVSGLNEILTSKENLNLFYIMMPSAKDSRFSSERSQVPLAVRRKEELC